MYYQILQNIPLFIYIKDKIIDAFKAIIKEKLYMIYCIKSQIEFARIRCTNHPPCLFMKHDYAFFRKLVLNDE